MTIAATFENLIARCAELRDALHGLRLTVVEDRPRRNGVLIVEQMGDSVDDLRGWLEEAQAAAERARKAVSHPIDGYHAHQELAAAHDLFLRLKYQFFFELASYDRIDELCKLSRARSGEWQAWNGSVRQALDQTRQAIRELDRALLASWQELAERISAGGVSVQTTNIGQLSERSTRSREQAGNQRTAREK